MHLERGVVVLQDREIEHGGVVRGAALESRAERNRRRCRRRDLPVVFGVRDERSVVILWERGEGAAPADATAVFDRIAASVSVVVAPVPLDS